MRHTHIAFALITLLGAPMLTGCDSGNIVTGGKDEKVTAVPMGDIDSAEGTISDEMINTDESTDEAPLDNSPVAASAAPKKQDAASKKPDESKPEKTPDSSTLAQPAALEGDKAE
jgi:hypothetical protein